MIDRERADGPDAGEGVPETPDMDRRTALKNIGALAGAAPAVTLLLTPSASRARGDGGSPCEGPGDNHCGGDSGHGGHDGHDGRGGGHDLGQGWGRDEGNGRGRDNGWSDGRGRDRDRGWKPGGSRKPKGREL